MLLFFVCKTNYAWENTKDTIIGIHNVLPKKTYSYARHIFWLEKNTGVCCSNKTLGKSYDIFCVWSYVFMSTSFFWNVVAYLLVLGFHIVWKWGVLFHIPKMWFVAQVIFHFLLLYRWVIRPTTLSLKLHPSNPFVSPHYLLIWISHNKHSCLYVWYSPHQPDIIVFQQLWAFCPALNWAG